MGDALVGKNNIFYARYAFISDIQGSYYTHKHHVTTEPKQLNIFPKVKSKPTFHLEVISLRYHFSLSLRGCVVIELNGRGNRLTGESGSSWENSEHFWFTVTLRTTKKNT